MDDKTLTSLGELSKPATVLIERIGDALGGLFRPYQLRRVARAEADVAMIMAEADIAVADLRQRAMRRFVLEEARKQENMESIMRKALPQVGDTAKPEGVDEDWIANFFDKCRLVSDDEMQALWAKVLAGEANTPGGYSKRTIDLLGSLDKYDCEIFARLCGFGWLIGDIDPLIYDVEDPIYMSQGISFGVLKHLDAIGLISFDSLAGYRRTRLPKHLRLAYYDTKVDIEFEKDDGNELEVGHVLLSRTGQELAPICGSKPVPGFVDYVISRWLALKLVASAQRAPQN